MSSAQVPLQDLMRGLGGVPFGSPSEIIVRSISTDSRRVSGGCLFIALHGAHTHGRRFVPAALARGACALLLPIGTQPPEGASGYLHPSPETILAELAIRLYGRPAQHLRLYGVTGTNGKTTTALLLKSLLAAGGESTAYWTTTLVRVGDTEFRPKWTTPPAHELQRFLSTAREYGQQSVVMEVTSHAVKLGRIAGLRYEAGIATNISPDHLDFHPDFSDYVASKRSFISGLDERAAAFLCADDPIVLGFRAVARCATFTFGLGQGADIGARDVRPTQCGVEFTLEVRSAELRRRFGAAELSLALPMWGRYNVLNALSAIGVAIRAGVGQDAARSALAQFSPPPRRLELQSFGPYTVLNDVAMNEASYDAVLAAVRDLPHRPVVLVHAPRGQRGPELNARIARILSRWNEELRFSPVIVSLSRGELSRYAVDHQVQDSELAALVDTASQESLPLEMHGELVSAVRAGVERLEPGGILVLLGTFGMDDGPALAETLLSERLGQPPKPHAPRYLEPTDGSF